MNNKELSFDYCFICTGLYYRAPGITRPRNQEPLNGADQASSSASASVDIRKSPRRKRGALSSSSKTQAPASTSQRFKAIFGDPVVGPMFHSFLASRADFQREYNALLLLTEINRWQNSLVVNEKRSSSSSSSSASSVSVNRASRKQFASIIQQFVSAGAPQEVRFTLHGRDPVKDHLLMIEPKMIETTVFKPARRAILNILVESALEAFYDATALNPPPPVVVVPSQTDTSLSNGFNFGSPQARSLATGPSLARTQGSSISRHTSSGTLMVHASAKGEHGPDVKSKRRRSTSSSHNKEQLLSQSTPKPFPQSPSNSKDNKLHIQALSQLQAHNQQQNPSATNSSPNTPTKEERETDSPRLTLSSTPNSTPNSSRSPTPSIEREKEGRSLHEKSIAKPRLVMEIHELYTRSEPQMDHTNFPSPTAISAVSSSGSTASTNTYGQNGNISSGSNLSPRSTWSISGTSGGSSTSGLSYLSGGAASSAGGNAQSQQSSLNQRYPMAIPPMRTLSSMTVESFMQKDELESLAQANRIVIVGGDIVAIEFAAEMHDKFPKKTISIVHSHRHLLVSMEESVRLIVDNFLKNRNINVHRKKHVVFIQPFRMSAGSPDVYHILLDDGSILEADKVVCYHIDYQHGRTSFLEQNFSEHLDGRGFAKVDPYMRFANTENIFALGDVAAINEYKVAERARAHASLLTANFQRLVHALEIELYRPRPIPKTLDLLLGPTKGIQIENGRFVRIGSGSVERREFAERRILHRFGAVSLVLRKEWSIRRGGRAKAAKDGNPAPEDETAGSRGETSSDAKPAVRSKKKIRNRRLSDNAAEEDSDERKPKTKPR